MEILLELERGGGASKRRAYASERRVGIILLAADLVVVALALAAYLMTVGRYLLWALDVDWLALAGFVMFPLARYAAGLYPGHGMSGAWRFRAVTLSTLAGILGFLAMAWLPELLGGNRPSMELGLFALVTALVLFVGNPIARRLLAGAGFWRQPVFIFGSGDTAAEVARQLKLYPHLGYMPACIVDDGSVYVPEEEHGVPVVRFKELSRYAAQLGEATTAIVIERVVERSLILQLYTTGIFKRILLIPACHDLISLKSSVRRVGGMLSIEMANDRPSRLAALGKRAFDLTLAGIAMLVLAPVLAAITLAVRLDSPGPVLFVQPRWAGHDRTFKVLKFRTMYVDGERRLKRHFLRNPQAEAEWQRFHKLDRDPRVTRTGRFLRSVSLDELPQLINVLRGEMSLVGPRPYTVDELSKLGPARQILSATLPGITGFWQVSGRNRRTFRERIEMDCYYVRNLSIWLDVWILYRTLIGMIARDGK